MIFSTFKPAPTKISLYFYLRGLAFWWLVPLTLIAGTAVGLSTIQLQDGRSKEAEKWAMHLANEIDLDLAKRLEGLRTVAALAATRQQPSLNQDWYRSVKAYDQSFGMPVMLVDTRRRILRHSRRPPGAPLPELPPHKGRPAFQQAVESGQAQIGDPVAGPILDRPVVPLILPLPRHGEVLMGLVSTDAFQRVLFPQALPAGWQASLLDSFGREIASTRQSDEVIPSKNDRRAQISLTTAPFKVVVDVGAATYYREALFLGGLLLFGLTLTVLLIGQGARRASLGLTASVRQLADPAGMPAQKVDFPAIEEIEAARLAGLRNRARGQFLLGLGDTLRPLSDAGRLQDEGCRILAEFLGADRVFFSEFDHNAGVARVSRESRPPQAVPLTGEYQMARLGRALEALRDGQTVAISDVNESEFLSPKDRQFCLDLGVVALMVTPVIKDERLMAALFVAQAEPTTWDQADCALVKEVGARVWSAMARAAALEALSARTLELTVQTRQLRWLASELTLAEHKTRELISKALHDHLQQILFSTSLTLQRALAKSAGDPILEQTKLGLKEAMEAARSLSLEIFPPVLRSEGLPSALQWLATWTQKKHSQVVEVSADPQADPQALDVRILLFECVRELLFNAVKHARAHTITVRLSMEPGQMVQILLADDGVGFDPKQALKSGGEVLGLGLFSIRERLTLLGGELKVDSAPGQGARFCLRVPQKLGLEKDQALALGQSQPGPDDSGEARATAVDGALRILLVDDHAMVRDGLRQLIDSHANLQVVGEAVNGIEAISEARTLRPDVVVMDRSMPMLDGVAATREILAENPDVVILGMSMDEGDVCLQFEKAGATGFFCKKDGAEQLLQRLEFERFMKLGGGGLMPTRPAPQ